MLARHTLARSFVGALAAMFIGFVARPASAVGALRVEGSRFVDETGAVVVLRGVNVAGDSKVPPFRPAADTTIFDPLPSFGMNAVRLLFTWEAYEPERGKYDASYLAYYVTAARAAAAKGLHVIVDFHQDAYSRYALGGCGEGAPRWALDPAVEPATPDNGPACKSWGVALVTDEEMHGLFRSFYADVNGVRTAYLAMVRSVAKALADEPGVIGYDLMNEPWSDAEGTELAAFQAAGFATIREVSPNAIAFVSPRAYTSSGAQTELPKPAYENAAYAPHFYDATVLVLRSWSGVEPVEPFARMTGKAAEWNVPLFLGEFGAPPNAHRGLDYVDMLYRRLDDGFHSGAHWVYTPGWTEEKKDGWNVEDLSIVDGTRALRDNFRVRPHPQRIAGEPVAFGVTHEPPTLVLRWQHEPSKGETRAFLPSTWLGGEADIVAEGVTCELAAELLRCHGDGATSATVSVRASAAGPSVGAAGGCGGACATSHRAPSGRGAPSTIVVLTTALALGLRRRSQGRAPELDAPRGRTRWP
ncbi:MAG: cellulase family glycosylhydrolase [Deltaproteobacteria bacterium]|nr:cellulase family glycosylhydrolase [Deltaproteobacteria bacterium]